MPQPPRASTSSVSNSNSKGTSASKEEPSDDEPGEESSGSGSEDDSGGAGADAAAAHGRLFLEGSPGEGSTDTADAEETESEDDDEHFTAGDRQPAGHDVEQVRLPVSIRELYTFLELVHDSGEGRRVYMCEGPLAGEGGAESPASSGPGRRKAIKISMKNQNEKAFKEQEDVERMKEETKKSLGSRRRCIVKVWQKAARPPDETKRWLDVQLQLLRMERHPNVALPRRIREDEHAYYVEFDAVLIGCSLLQVILNDASTTENQVRKITKGILSGLDHLHKHGLSHRDLKPDNVLLEWRSAHSLLARNAKPPNGWWSTKNGVRQWRPATKFKSAWTRHDLHLYVRIIDLDTVSDAKADSICGTPGYMAPEAYLQNAGPKGDLFGVGIMLYLLIRCDSPCHEVVHQILGGDHLSAVPRATRERLTKSVRACFDGIDWSGQPWDGTPMARDLCRLLCKSDPKVRGEDAGDVLHTCPWFQKSGATIKVEDLAHLRPQAVWNEGDQEMATASRRLSAALNSVKQQQAALALEANTGGGRRQGVMLQTMGR